MPTVIVLDVSLSMCKTVKNLATKDANSSTDSIEVKQLANVGIGVVLDYFAQNAQLEHTALVVFSSLWEIKCPFTRHHESIKNGIYDLELYDKSNVVNAIRGLSTLKLQDWVQNGPINIILITDGQLYHENMCSQTNDDEENPDRLNDGSNDAPLSELEGLFDFPCKIQVVCLASPRDFALKYSLPFYKSLVSAVDGGASECPVLIGTDTKHFKKSAIWLPETDSMDISMESVEELFSKIAEHHYKPYHTTLSCGHLSSIVMLSPKPTECLLEPLKNEFDDLKNEQSLNEDAKETFVSAINKSRLYKLSEEISICGFMPLSEVASPAVISRHLLMPIVNNKFNETSKAEQILSQDPNAYSKSLQAIHEGLKMESNDNHPKRSELDSKAGKSATGNTGHSSIVDQDITKQPSFCVLLHNGLKQENMVAICMVGKNDETNDDWFGMLHAHTDSKKRSSLMLSLLIPGANPILWLPSFRTMGSSILNSDLPPAIREKLVQSRGPLKSYSSNNVIWLDPESVQADVQKIVRHAKRSPDKVPHFYKELNRIRRAAISYGFYDVLFGLAAILEREKRVMMIDQNKNLNQEMLDHIDHVVASLRSSLNEASYDTNIAPKA